MAQRSYYDVKALTAARAVIADYPLRESLPGVESPHS
jgi:hypothetical protein